MKRLKRVFLPAVLVLCMVLCMFPITANAEASASGIPSDKLISPDDPNAETLTYTAALSETGSAGHYLLIVFKQSTYDETITGAPASFTADDILYIDQVTLTEAGTVQFKEWAPKSSAGGYAVIIGASSRELVGWLEALGIDVSGLVKYLGTVSAATYTVTDGSGTVITSGTTGADGTITDAIPEGTYTLTVDKRSHLKSVVTITVSGDSYTIPTIDLVDGDTNDDGYVNADDLTNVLTCFGSSEIPSSNLIDIDEDTYINANDLSSVLTGFGQSEF